MFPLFFCYKSGRVYAHLPFELLLDLLIEQIVSLLILLFCDVRTVGYYLGDETIDAEINALRAVVNCSRHCVILSKCDEILDKIFVYTFHRHHHQCIHTYL